MTDRLSGHIAQGAKTLILCNRVSRLAHSLRAIDGPLRYLSLADTLESREICEHLRTRPDTEELSRAQLFRGRNRDFWRTYIEFLGRLNVQNHSPDWWAMTFTAKSPLATSLGLNIFHFLLIVELVGREPRPLLVVTENPDLIAQARQWGSQTGIRVVNSVKASGRVRRFLKHQTPAGIVRTSLRTSLIWFLTRRNRPPKNSQDEHLVITTLTHPQSFVTPTSYRDVYFGPLVDHVSSLPRKALIIGLMVERPFKQLQMLKQQDFNVHVFPVESFVTLTDLLACTLRALRCSLRPVEPREAVELEGIDLKPLVRRAIREASRSGDLFLSLLMYYCGRSLGSTLRVTRLLYPYENRAWEKMLVQGIRVSSPQTQIVGYQHASVAPVHANFYLGQDEALVAPLPDSILTTGKVVQERLESEGNYPPGIFKTACALRRSQPLPAVAKGRREATTRVLVALATSLEEHVNTLDFVGQAFRSQEKYQVRIRPHPAFSMDRVLKAAASIRPNFFEPSTESLAEDLAWADIVLYATSTVGLEAVSLGIPVVHLDLGEPVDADPMFGWDEFRWSVADPPQLLKTIGDIEDLPETEFLARQKKGQEYADDYLRPVTAAGLRAFTEA